MNRTYSAAENERAFLKLLRFSEFGRIDDGDYQSLYGFKSFADDRDHPNQRIVVGHRKDGADIVTTAAGAYQIVHPKYLEAVNAGIASDFTPASQDKIALWIIGRHHALNFVNHGQIASAISRLTKEWVSLPGGSHPKLSLASALSKFEALRLSGAGGPR